ncbi:MULTISPECIES: pentapeptide repeat-containing protein [Serratia]|uniref:pentapeptide repeat-containing protein n=1 Tax=Serratia TaxID=613 RepID=UPI0029D991B1|nr:pentapeptide repeat-containing protein [Serratia marcescens]MDX7543765.1 pentapeptide repeat-containing protein [Serratia marcescens]MDX7565404.1 pentapeptide repeat-containing protein [Serratia marcescens]
MREALRSLLPTIIIFFIFIVIVISLSFLWGYYNNNHYPYNSNSFYNFDFLQNLLINLNASIVDFLVLGVIIIFFERRREHTSKQNSLIDDLKDYASYSSEEINLKKAGLLKRLNQSSVKSLNIQRIIITNTSIKDIKFISGNISGSSFEKSKMRKVYLKNMILKSVNFNESNLDGCHFKNCNMYNVKMKDASAIGIQLNESSLINVQFNNSNLKGCDLRNCDLKNVNFEDANLSRANILGAKNISIDALVKAENLDYIIAEDHVLEEIKKKRPESVHQTRRL